MSCLVSTVHVNVFFSSTNSVTGSLTHKWMQQIFWAPAGAPGELHDERATGEGRLVWGHASLRNFYEEEPPATFPAPLRTSHHLLVWLRTSLYNSALQNVVRMKKALEFTHLCCYRFWCSATNRHSFTGPTFLSEVNKTKKKKGRFFWIWQRNQKAQTPFYILSGTNQYWIEENVCKFFIFYLHIMVFFFVFIFVASYHTHTLRHKWLWCALRNLHDIRDVNYT